MRAYLQSNHINSRDVTSSRVHYVVTAGGKRKRKKRKRVLRVILDLTYNIQHTETENKFLKKKPEKKKSLGRHKLSKEVERYKLKNPLVIYPCRPIPAPLPFHLVDQSPCPPMRGSRQSTIDPRRHLCGF